MKILRKFEKLNIWARGNIWLARFAIVCRIALAAGFIPSGIVKIVGERFASGLPVNHPMGHYLEALQLTGYYYPFIGVMQILAAILLLIPRTSVLGLFLYFPIILNITILSHSVRFDGSLFTSPLMVAACVYLFVWYFHRWKYILPFYKNTDFKEIPINENRSKKFPLKFFAGVFVSMLIIVFGSQAIYNVMPRNALKTCLYDCENNKNPEACKQFCECSFTVHSNFGDCLDEYQSNLK